ncbi:MAG: NUDIX domain-containing protein [Betaproteobacteria bacterium]|nr:NUDIX domain-containing protein [Betaproteobacteria bacterium]
MDLSVNVFDVWPFRRSENGIEYLLLYTSQEKADRYFNGGRFWQIPSGFIDSGEKVVGAIKRHLHDFGLNAASIGAAEHTYSIYNRRYETMQLIGVYAAEVRDGHVLLNPVEHAEFGWYSFAQALTMLHFRGLKDGLRSTVEYITGVTEPAKELQLL